MIFSRRRTRRALELDRFVLHKFCQDLERKHYKPESIPAVARNIRFLTGGAIWSGIPGEGPR